MVMSEAMAEWKVKVDAAHKMVHALCRPRGSPGSREWIMSIPAEPDRDPDLVIAAGLRAAEKEIERLQTALALQVPPLPQAPLLMGLCRG